MCFHKISKFHTKNMPLRVGLQSFGVSGVHLAMRVNGSSGFGRDRGALGLLDFIQASAASPSTA